MMLVNSTIPPTMAYNHYVIHDMGKVRYMFLMDRAQGLKELQFFTFHYNDVIMGVIESQINSLTIVYSIVYSDADQ